jgi:acyl-CoA thioester hydrolase
MMHPPTVHETRVKPEWVDYNRHMGVFAYGIAFSDAGDAFMARFGIDEDYRKATGCTIYTLATHTGFLAEAHEDEPITVDAQILDADHKRAHLFLRMHSLESGRLLAVQEVLLMHMRLEEGAQPRAEAFPNEAQGRLDAMKREHAALHWPEGAGAKIAVRRRKSKRFFPAKPAR